MEKRDIEKQIIANYQKDEHMMILVFAQWCVNHDLDPQKIYQKAYPGQQENPVLLHAVELTVPKEESEEIPDETLLNVLSLYNNYDLAYVVTEEINKLGGK